MNFEIDYQNIIPRIQKFENHHSCYSSILSKKNNIKMKQDENIHQVTDQNSCSHKESGKTYPKVGKLEDHSDSFLKLPQSIQPSVNAVGSAVPGDTMQNTYLVTNSEQKDYTTTFGNVERFSVENSNLKILHSTDNVAESTQKPTNSILPPVSQTVISNESLMFQDDFYQEEEIGPDKFNNKAVPIKETSLYISKEEADVSNNDDADEDDNDDGDDDEEIDTDSVTEDKEFISYELEQAHRVLRELMSDSYKNINWPFMQAVDANMEGCYDYYDSVKRPIWLFKSLFLIIL